MPLHFIVSVLPVAIFLGWYNLFMFSLDFFIFSFEYQTPMWSQAAQSGADYSPFGKLDFSSYLLCLFLYSTHQASLSILRPSGNCSRHWFNS